MKLLFICLLFCLSASAQIDTTAAFSQPLIVVKGGQYSGNYRSDNAGIPAISINTTETVILKDIYAVGQGECIHANGGANVQADNIYCRSLDPIGSAQRKWAFYMYQPNSLTLTHFFFYHTGGSRIEQQKTTTQNIVIKYGQIINTDRRNGYNKVSGTSIAPALQISNLTGLTASEIGWIYFQNDANASYVEDNVNLYNSGGKDSLHNFLVHDICVNGGYPFPADSIKYSGTGITTDGDKTCSFIQVYNSTFVRNMNAAMNLPNGHHIKYFNNRIVNSGLLNGVALPMSWSATCMWRKLPDPNYYQDSIVRNSIGYYHKGTNYLYVNRQDENTSSVNLMPKGLNYYFPDRSITTADEDAEVATFWQKTKDAGVTIGVTYKGQTTIPPPITDTTKTLPCIPIHDTIRIHDTLKLSYPVHDTIYKKDTLYRVPKPLEYEWTPIKPTSKNILHSKTFIAAKHEEMI